MWGVFFVDVARQKHVVGSNSVRPWAFGQCAAQARRQMPCKINGRTICVTIVNIVQVVHFVHFVIVVIIIILFKVTYYSYNLYEVYDMYDYYDYDTYLYIRPPASVPAAIHFAKHFFGNDVLRPCCPV